MLTSVLTLTLALVNATPSATTMAAVAVFAANVDRQWPTDDREPLVTAEAARLMSLAAQAIAADAKVNDAKLRESLATLDSTREVLSKQAPDDRDRAKTTRKLLQDGVLMVDRLAVAANAATAAADRAALKKAADGFDANKPVAQQVDALEKYFQQAARLLKSMLG